MDKGFPAIISKAQFRRVNKLMCSRAPKINHPRRVGSSYLLTGLVKCRTCNRALSGQDSKSGQFSYYVCQSLMKRGSGACDTPSLNARRFEELVVGKIPVFQSTQKTEVLVGGGLERVWGVRLPIQTPWPNSRRPRPADCSAKLLNDPDVVRCILGDVH